MVSKFIRSPSLDHQIDKTLLQLSQQVGLSEAPYANLLHLCTNASALLQGKRVHSHLVTNGFGQSQNLKHLLIKMYGKCGELETAKSVFDSLNKRSLLAWKALITAYAQRSQSRAVLDLYHLMKKDGFEADQDLYARVIGACGCLRDLIKGETLHAEIQTRNVECSTVISTALVSMYGKCGNVEMARRLFEGVQEKDIVCWNAMISAHARSQTPREAVELFKRMVDEGRVEANAVTYVCVLGACSVLQAVEEGRALHLSLRKTSLRSAVLVNNALISFYASCRRLDDAIAVFEQAEARNVVSWNAVMAACVQHGRYREALDFYEVMDVEPDGITYTTVLSACSSVRELRVGQCVHSRIVRTGLKPDSHLQLALVNMHAKCGDLQTAAELFDALEVKDISAWNVLIVAHAEQGYSREALTLYKRLELEGIEPDELTVASVVSACSSLEMVKQAEDVVAAYNMVRKSSLRVENALVSMYARCGRLRDAEAAFDKIKRKDVVSWTSMIAGYAQRGECEKAVIFFRRMIHEGVEPNEATLASFFGACSGSSLDGVRMHSALESGHGSKTSVVVQTALLNMYSKCGSLETARCVFDEIQQKDLICWNAMLAAYAHCGALEPGLELYNRMVAEGVRPDANTFTNLLVACTCLGALEEGTDVHAKVVRSGFDSSVVIVTSLINMYAKCGRVELAKDVFSASNSRKRSRCGGNSVVWNALLSALAHHGHGLEALALFERMSFEGVEADDISVRSVLVACNHAGLDYKGWLAFINMLDDYEVRPGAEHYVCMVDLLGRCGKLEECEDLIDHMPFEPHVVAWISLLSGCKDHGELRRGHRAVAEVLMFDPTSDAPHNLLLIDVLMNSQFT